MPPKPNELLGLVIAALVLVIILIVCFMCIQLYTEHKPKHAADGFHGEPDYAPGFVTEWPGRRVARRLLPGALPSIDFAVPFVREGAPCCGYLGVPP